MSRLTNRILLAALLGLFLTAPGIVRSQGFNARTLQRAQQRGETGNLYGTNPYEQTVNRGAVMPGMLVKHKDGTWTASANLRGRLYLHRGIERTYTRDLLVEVFLDGRGNGLNH